MTFDSISKRISAHDVRRLIDGARALALPSLPNGASLAVMTARRSLLEAACRAMQSLDDLGSAEANAQAWSDLSTLIQRLDELEIRIRSASS